MQRVQNVPLQEILSMERSIPGCLLIIDAIRDLAENDLEDLETKENEMLLFQKLLETYPELPSTNSLRCFHSLEIISRMTIINSLLLSHFKDGEILISVASGQSNRRGKKTDGI